MLKSVSRLVLLACVFAVGVASSYGQLIPAAPTSASTNAPAATPPSPIALGDIAVQAQAAVVQLQNDKDGLDPDTAFQGVTDQLPDLKTQIEDRSTEDKRLFEAATSLSALQASQAIWQTISGNLDTAQKTLSERVRELDNLLGQLNTMDATWQATLAAATKTNAPPEIVQTIQGVRKQIADTTKAVNAHLLPFYVMQDQIAGQAKLTDAGLATIKRGIDAGWAELFQRNHAPLWDPQAFAHPPADLVLQEKNSIGGQIAALQTYLRPKTGALIIHLIVLLLLVMGFYWIRNLIRAQAEKEPDLQHALEIFDLPMPTALLLAILASLFLYPHAPRLMWAIVGATTLIPAVIVTRRLIDPVNFPILYAAVIGFFVDQVRYVVTPAGIVSRLLFLAELMAVLIFIIVVFRANNAREPSSAPNLRKRITHFYLHLAFFVIVFAGFANVMGYLPLSFQMGNGMLNSSYLAVILYAAVRIADAMAITAMSLPPISRFGMVRRHKELIYANVMTCNRWVVFVVWLVIALKIFFIYDPLWTLIGAVLAKDHHWGSLEFEIGPILAFPITIWAAFLMSRLIRFALEEELYPKLQMGRGIPYATSTMVHYAILVLGFFIAVKAGGADLTQFSFLAGAFGVGLGFGLQNIFNNFISGIILLFERPIKVGDDIQIDATTMGRVERIGIRASVILLTNGSEMIVPNGNLISNPVTNWTLSNCERLIEIPITVTSKVDPQKVLDLLCKIARAHVNVLKNPPPQALLVTIGASLAFRLRAWIDSEEEYMKISSDLALAINAALAKENITIA